MPYLWKKGEKQFDVRDIQSIEEYTLKKKINLSQKTCCLKTVFVCTSEMHHIASQQQQQKDKLNYEFSTLLCSVFHKECQLSEKLSKL